MDTFRCGICETSSSTAERTCTYEEVTAKIFFVSCRRTNIQCSSTTSAFVPAITVCNQRL